MRTPAVRLFPAPPLEPPFDDQLPPQTHPMPPDAGAQLALPWRRPDRRRAESRRAESLRAEARRAETERTGTERTGTERTGTERTETERTGPRHVEALGVEAPRVEVPPGALAGASPAARHAAVRFLERCQEILNGYRPASHIRQMSAPMEAQTIMECVAAVARRTSRPPRAPRPGARPDAVARGPVRVCEPRPGAVEAMAVLSQASRSWAVAFRLERRGGAWQCTAFADVIRQP